MMVAAAVTPSIRSSSCGVYSSSTRRWPESSPSAMSSAWRLAKPRNRVTMKPHTSSHCEAGMPTPTVPARMRSMKPMAMMNTSSTTTCLSPAL